MQIIRRSSFVVAMAALAGLTLTSVGAIAQHAAHREHQKGMSASLSGQDAFGAIQEIVGLLEADPSTDWSRVDIGVLRKHLIDMHEVTINAVTVERSLANGVEITVTGQGRMRGSIQRMIPAHAKELVALGWAARTEVLTNGVKLTVTSNDPMTRIKLKALGFAGIMVQGGHHQPHHLMMAKGQFAH